MKKCTNAEPGTFNHECGKPAQWAGTAPSGFVAYFCDQCKEHGHERHGKTFDLLEQEPAQ